MKFDALNEYEAANLLGLSVHAMRMRRYSKPPRGPVWYLEGGGRIRYRREDIEQYLRELPKWAKRGYKKVQKGRKRK